MYFLPGNVICFIVEHLKVNNTQRFIYIHKGTLDGTTRAGVWYTLVPLVENVRYRENIDRDVKLLGSGLKKEMKGKKQEMCILLENDQKHTITTKRTKRKRPKLTSFLSCHSSSEEPVCHSQISSDGLVWYYNKKDTDRNVYF